MHARFAFDVPPRVPRARPCALYKRPIPDGRPCIHTCARLTRTASLRTARLRIINAQPRVGANTGYPSAARESTARDGRARPLYCAQDSPRCAHGRVVAAPRPRGRVPRLVRRCTATRAPRGPCARHRDAPGRCVRVRPGICRCFADTPRGDGRGGEWLQLKSSAAARGRRADRGARGGCAQSGTSRRPHTYWEEIIFLVQKIIPAAHTLVFVVVFVVTIPLLRPDHPPLALASQREIAL